MAEPFVPNHQHMLIHARLRNPPTTKAQIEDWLHRVVAAVEMEVLIGPFAVRCDDLGNEGVTGVIVLSTSHCSIHVWDKQPIPYMNFDLYSCKTFSLEQLDPLLREFDPYYYSYIEIDRNDQVPSPGRSGVVRYHSDP